jgi:hypothetical protein
LFLVAAMALSLVFVVLALILNSAIYTENLATRQSEVGSADEVTVLRESVQTGLGGLMDHVNRNGGDDGFGDRDADFQVGVANWTRQEGYFSALSGHDTSVEYGDAREGTRVVDDDDTTAFVPRDGSTTAWTVATDVKIRRFRMAVNASEFPGSFTDTTVESALGSLSSTGPFMVEIDDGTSTWIVAVYDDGSDTAVTVKDGSAFYTCKTGASTAVVDLTAGTVGGTTCPALERIDPEGPVAVEYHNPDQIVGTWMLTVDRPEPSFRSAVNYDENTTHCGNSVYEDGPGSGVPYTTEAVYSSTVRMTYADPNVEFSSDVRVARGEIGGAAHAPTIDSVTVTDAGADDFEVDWSVSDPDGDLSQVVVEAEGATVDTASVGGATASASGIEIDESGSSVEITVVVTDVAGNARQVTQVHDEDDDATGCPP